VTIELERILKEAVSVKDEFKSMEAIRGGIQWVRTFIWCILVKLNNISCVIAILINEKYNSFTLDYKSEFSSVFMYAMNIQNDVIGLVLRENCKQVTDFIAWPSRCHDTILDTKYFW
jgi:hypothetical protein